MSEAAADYRTADTPMKMAPPVVTDPVEAPAQETTEYVAQETRK